VLSPLARRRTEPRQSSTTVCSTAAISRLCGSARHESALRRSSVGCMSRIIVVSLPLFGYRGRSSTQPRAVYFSLMLSLAKLGPETGTRVGPTAAVIQFLRGDGNGPSPQPSPKTCQRHLARPHEVR